MRSRAERSCLAGGQTEMASTLDTIAANPDQKQRLEQYKALLSDYLGSSSLAECRVFVDHLVSDQVPLVMSRQLLQHFATEINALPMDVQKALAQYALERVQPRVVSFEEQVAVIREKLAAVHEQEEEWSKAAQTLAGIDLDSGMRQLDNEYKLAKNIKISMLFLEDDDAVSAETYIKKASTLITSCKKEELELQYKSCYARILDAKRRFLEAATRYYELSQIQQKGVSGRTIDEEDRVRALQSAVTCVVLAPPGPQRSRVLAQLYKDERCCRLPLFPFLEKVYMERILSRAEVDAFSQALRPHQLALLPDGSTVLERAVVEHNLAAAAKLYANIYCEELGALLGVSAERAEQVAARMIAEGRLTGHVDQVSSLVTFGESAALRFWDQQVQALCSSLNGIVDQMAAKGIKLEMA